jgi:hypothetical protein
MTTINLFLIKFSKEMQPQKTKRHEQVLEKSVLQKRDYLRTSFYRGKKGWGGRGAPAQKS